MKATTIYPLEHTKAMKPVSRTVKLERTRNGLVMVTNVGRYQGAYRVKEIPAVGFDVRGFQLEKIFGGTDADASGYAVFLSNRGQHNCCCRGFLRHHHCTHIDGLRTLIDRGELPPQLTPTPVIPTPEPRRYTPEEWKAKYGRFEGGGD